MFDSITQSADGLIILLYVVFLITFFVFGPHKVYESIFGALVGLGCYLLIHEMTFVTPDFTRTLFFGNWLVENRGILLWCAKILIGILFLMTPLTLGLNVAGVVRGTVWFFLKVIILSAFFVIFSIVLLGVMSSTSGALGQVIIFPRAVSDFEYFQKSLMYAWIVDKSYIILLAGFALGVYKIIFSHWINRILLLGGVVYVKGNQLFGKKELDVHLPAESSEEAENHEDMHNSHH